MSPALAPVSGARSWWRHRSLRARLTAAACLVMAIALSAAGLLLVLVVRHNLLSSLDTTARARARVAASLATQDGVIPNGAQADAVVQIVGPNGAVVGSTTNAIGEPRLFTFSPGDSVAVRSVHALPVHDSADSYRVAAARTPSGGIAYAAVPSDDATDAVRLLSGAVALGLPALIGLLTLVTWLLVGRALRPVDEIRRQAAEITLTDLDRRLALPAAQDELRRLAQTLNDMLRRLDESTRRQREFVADAAHELRSPLAALRTQLEVAARHPDDGSEAFPVLLREVERMSRLAEDLLRLARLDARASAEFRPVELDEIVRSEVALVSGTDVRVDLSPRAVRVLGDAEALSRMVRNVLSNAVRHADSVVTITIDQRGNGVVVTVADDGPGIPVADRDRVFERFTRLDSSRSRADGGAGLGLAIAREVAVVHGGSIVVTDSTRGAAFEIRLPAVVPPREPIPPSRAAPPDAPPVRSLGPP